MSSGSEVGDNSQRGGERIRALLAVLAEVPDGMAARDVIAAVEQRIGLTEHEAGEFSSGGRRFDRLLRFETIELVKCGWLVKEAGTWRITPEGVDALAAYTDPEELRRVARRGYAEWQRGRPDEADETEAGSPSDDVLARSVTVEQAIEDATAEIRAHLAAVSPYKFQDMVGHLLTAMGYRVAWVAPPGKDRGIDLLAHKDPILGEGPRIKVQVKREQSKTDAKTLRAFMSVLHPGDVGVFVTLGGFTSDAESEARNSETKKLTLIDFADFLRLWSEFYPALTPEGQASLPLTFVPFLSADY